MKGTYIIYNGGKIPVAFGFTIDLDKHNSVIQRIIVLEGYEDLGHDLALMRNICRDADREFRNLYVVKELDTEIEDFGFVASCSSFVRKWNSDVQA